MASTLTLNILLGIVCLGFVLFIWAGGLPSGPEGPVGAWIVPVPFLFLLLGVMVACIRRGRFDRLPGGKLAAAVLLVGFMVGVGASLLAAFERRDSALDPLMRLIPLFALAGCFWAAGGLESFGPPRPVTIFGAATLMLMSMAGWGVMGFGLVSRVRGDIEAANNQYLRDRANDEARQAKASSEFRSLPPDAPLRQVIQFEFVSDEAIQKEARDRIARWPGLENEIAKILTSDTLSISDLSWTISYIADIYPSPPATLAPAYAHVLDKGYRYWESTMKYDQYASKSEPEVSMLIRGAERIQKAGGDLRPQLRPWYDLLKQARGMRALAGYVQDVMQGR